MERLQGSNGHRGAGADKKEKAKPILGKEGVSPKLLMSCAVSGGNQDAQVSLRARKKRQHRVIEVDGGSKLRWGKL